MSRMPPDSNWKMPLVKPLVKTSYVFGVVERQIFDDKLYAAVLLDQALGDLR